MVQIYVFVCIFPKELYFFTTFWFDFAMIADVLLQIFKIVVLLRKVCKT
jgi:hypothetical protein